MILRILVFLLALGVGMAQAQQVDVTRVGTADTDAAGGLTGSFTFEVDASAQLVVVYVAGYRGTNATGGILTELYWNTGSGQQFNHIISADRFFDTSAASVYYMNVADSNWPPTGPQDLNWVTTSNGQGMIVLPVSYENVDVSTAVSSIGASAAGLGVECNPFASMGPVAPEDLGVVVANELGTATSPDPAPAGSGQTSRLEQDQVNNSTLAVGDGVGEDQMRVVPASDPGYMPCLQFQIIYAEATVGGPSIPLLRRRGR